MVSAGIVIVLKGSDDQVCFSAAGAWIWISRACYRLFRKLPTAQRGFAQTPRWRRTKLRLPYRDLAVWRVTVDDYPKRWPVRISWYSPPWC